MFNFGFGGEILIIAIAALILIGPKELPEVLRACGRWLFRLKCMNNQFQQYIDSLIHAEQIEEFKKTSYESAMKKLPADTDVSKQVDERRTRDE